MELNEEDYDTVVSLRIPLSLARSVEKHFGGMITKRRGKSKAYVTAIQEGVQYVTLKEIYNDPEKIKEIESSVESMTTSDFLKDPAKILEPMDLNKIDTIMTLLQSIHKKKVEQRILDF